MEEIMKRVNKAIEKYNITDPKYASVAIINEIIDAITSNEFDVKDFMIDYLKHIRKDVINGSKTMEFIPLCFRFNLEGKRKIKIVMII